MLRAAIDSGANEHCSANKYRIDCTEFQTCQQKISKIRVYRPDRDAFN